MTNSTAPGVNIASNHGRHCLFKNIKSSYGVLNK